MSLITELKAKSNNADNTKKEIIEEIKRYFDEYLDGTGLENFLRARIGDSEIKARKMFTKIEFWAYHAGCSTTHFYCGGKEWYNPENMYDIESWCYKGIELRTIDKDVCDYLATKLVEKMDELGFTLLSIEPQKNSCGYYDTHFYFGW